VPFEGYHAVLALNDALGTRAPGGRGLRSSTAALRSGARAPARELELEEYCRAGFPASAASPLALKIVIMAMVVAGART